MGRPTDVSYTISESPEKMLTDDMLQFVFVYDARFADALMINQQRFPKNSKLFCQL